MHNGITLENTSRISGEELARSDIYLFHYYGGYVLLSSSLDTGMSTATGGGAGGAF